MGIIPLAKGVNLKASIRMADENADINMLYADEVSHNFIIEVENIGTSNTTGASYEIIELDTDNDINFDRDFILSSGNKKALLDTIRPGEKREIQLGLGSKPIEVDRKEKKIGIKITSYDTQVLQTKYWDDIVSINYYKTRVPFRFRSQNPVQGVIKAPGGSTYYFKTQGSNNNYTYSTNVPWSNEDYIIAFLGASVDTGSETSYSLAINAQAPSNWDSIVGDNQFLNEPANDTETTATVLDMEINRTFMGYLHDGDIDYYRVNLGDTPPEPRQGEGELTVYFNANGGSNVIAQALDTGRTATRPADPNKEGHIFDNWYSDAELTTIYNFSTPVTETITLYAKWIVILEGSFTVTFDANGGSGTVSALTENFATTITIPSGNALIKLGYTFVGWNTEPDGTGTNYNAGISYMITSDITLYANWVLGITNVNEIASYLSTASEGSSPSKPFILPMSVALTESNWNNILNAIRSAGKWVELDLSACTHGGSTSGNGLRSNGTFSPGNGTNTNGVNYIVSLVLPNTAREILSGINSYYTYLINVSGSGIINIGNNAFNGCTSLTSISFPATTSIGSNAFNDCTNPISISFPALVTIGDSAFRGFSGLTSVSIPEATSLGNNAFKDCTNLTSVSFPKVTTIAEGSSGYPYNGVFRGCTSLTSVSIPNTASIGESTFEGCTNLTSVSFPNATSIGRGAFNNTGLITIIATSFPNVTSVGDSAFEGLTSLTSVNFPEAMSISNNAFRNCTNLTSVSFPKVTTIAEGSSGYPYNGVFRGCTNLSNVTLNMVSSIGSAAFADTGSGTLTITMPYSAPTVGSNMFSGISTAKNVTVRIPLGASGYNATWLDSFKGGNSNVTVTTQTYTP